jgi:hypothetical protein
MHERFPSINEQLEKETFIDAIMVLSSNCQLFKYGTQCHVPSDFTVHQSRN